MTKKLIFFDENGNAVGVGDETVVTTPVKPGTYTTQKIIAFNGSQTQDSQEIDEAEYNDIKDPKKKLSLKDFKKKDK